MRWLRQRFKVPVLNTWPIMPCIVFRCNGSKPCCDKIPLFLMSTMSTVLPNKSVPMRPNSVAGSGTNLAAASNIFACRHVGCSQEETAGASTVAAAVSNVVVIVIAILGCFQQESAVARASAAAASNIVVVISVVVKKKLLKPPQQQQQYPTLSSS